VVATFTPKNKTCYKGRRAKLLMSLAGRPVLVLGEEILPASQTTDGKEHRRLVVRFHNSAWHRLTFHVRPCDVTEAA
jgi:hypothetical protein